MIMNPNEAMCYLSSARLPHSTAAHRTAEQLPAVVGTRHGRFDKSHMGTTHYLVAVENGGRE